MSLPTRLSEQGAEFIAGFEGFVGHGYNDPAGFCTIGYGHLLHRSACTAAELRRTISHDDALKLLQADAETFAECVLANVHPPISRQTRFDALVSFAFNLGCGPLQPGSGLHAALNTASRAGVADKLLEYDHAGGVRLPGLTRRRQAEARLWLRGKYA
jgi:GH24 family phage-related lysozyme (muramidase)